VIKSKLWRTCKFLEFFSSKSVITSHGLSDVASAYFKASSQKVLVCLVASVEIVLTIIGELRYSVIVMDLEEVLFESQEQFPVLPNAKP
jgi:hypothetical protein